MAQAKQIEWHEQWSMFQDDELFLFSEWISPNRLEDFEGKDILECGCGGGQHTSFMAPYARSITSVDLNTVDIARERNKKFMNVQFVNADIATMNLGGKFDVVLSVGVVHHTDDPDKTFENMKKHVKPGGKLIVWVYSEEGNTLLQYCVEPLRKLVLKNMSRKSLMTLSKVITSLMYIPVHTIYRLPLSFLPYYEYFENFRKLSFIRNTLNVFDKLNAPQVMLISKEKMREWFNEKEFGGVCINSYKGVSWSGSGVLS